MIPPEYIHYGGLMVPSGMVDAVYKAQREIEKDKRGRFFSDYVRYGMQDRRGMPSKPWSSPSFALLRLLGRESVIDRALIDARLAQMRRVARPCWVVGKQIGYRVVHKRHADSTFEMTDSVRKRCEQAMKFLEDGITQEVHPTIRNFFSICVEEELTIDRKAMIIFKNRRGVPYAYNLIDGATIKPRLQVLAPFMLEVGENNIDRAAQRMSDKLWADGYDVDITTAAYVQEINNRIVAAWTNDEMSIDTVNDTIELDKLFYGRSVLEKSLKLTGTFQNIWKYNDELFRTNTPEGIVLLFGDYDPQGLEAFRKQMLTEQSVGGHWRTPILPAGPHNEGMDGKYLKLRDTPKDALFSELLMQTAALKCAEYRAHPSIINIGTSGNTNSIIFQVNEEYQIGLSQEEGFHGLLDSIASWMTGALIKPFDEDLVLVWEGLDRDPIDKRVEYRIKELQYKTLDEVRATEDLPPMPTEIPQSIGSMVLSATALPAYQAIVQQQAMAQGQLNAAGEAPDQTGENPNNPPSKDQMNQDEEPLPPPTRPV
jgi:hypothetical protein